VPPISASGGDDFRDTAIGRPSRVPPISKDQTCTPQQLTERRILDRSRVRAPISPAEILREEFLVPLQLSPRVLAKIIVGEMPITPKYARFLGRALGTSADLWLNLQKHYEHYDLQKYYEHYDLDRNVPRSQR